MAKRLGIYGGTFNPPHLGHVGAAQSFVRHAGLDELLIIPAALPPHKNFDGGASTEDRLKMARLAFSGVDRATVSDLEIKRGGKSYTAITLSQLSAPDRELFFLCGTDMLLTLDTWYDFRTVFKLATICYVRRECDAEITRKIEERISEYKEKYGARIIVIPTDVIDVSSTELRLAIKSGVGAERYLSPAVYAYVLERGLYR